MSEFSLWWPTGGTGDGASPYSSTQITDWLRRTFLNVPASEGVLPNFGSTLAVTGSSSPLHVADGAAVVYGYPYTNSASVSVTVPTPTGGTTGHRVVLRATWGTTQTVRIALISSANGNSSYPALTQVAGTTWEIPLANLTITTGGVITINDARSLCHFNTMVSSSMLESLAVTADKLAPNSVIAAKIPDSSITKSKFAVPIISHAKHLGGSYLDLSFPGTTAYDLPGSNLYMQTGCSAISADPGNTMTITFPYAFSYLPMFFFTPISGQNGNGIEPGITISTTGVILKANGNSYHGVINWMAIGYLA